MPGAQASILIVVALATLVVPGAFLLALLGAVLRRRSGHEPGGAWSSAIAFLGGASLGTMFLLANDILVGAPLALVVVGVAIREWRVGREALAAQVVLGATLPWTLLWGTYMVLFSRGVVALDPAEAVVAFMAGGVPCALAILALVQRRRAAPLAAAVREVPATLPTSEPAGSEAGTMPTTPPPSGPGMTRSFRTVGLAMRDPSRLGPFGLPEIAALIALVASGLAVTALEAFGLPVIAGYLLAIVASSALATEAYLRAMAPRTRRSMEAFMWLGSWDLAQVRALTGEGVPTSSAGAARWLARHPEAPDEAPALRSLRVELHLLAGHTAEARASVERLPDATALERFERAASADLVAWWTGQGDTTDAMAEALAEIEPAGGDDRLRADVALAIARVRHLAVAQPPAPEPLAPLLQVRERLGRRADGLVRRILWPRLYRVFVVISLAFAVAGVATGISAPPF